MKKEEIIQAVNEVDDDLLESVQQARLSYTEKNRQSSMIRKAVISLTAMAAVIAGVMIINRKRPEEQEPVAAETPDPVPDIDGQGEKVTLALSHKLTTAAGLSVVMYPDLKEETDYNPWDESMNLQELPVFERNLSVTGAAWDLSEEEMRALLKKYTDWFGYTVTGESVRKTGEYDKRHRTANHEPGVPDGTVLSVTFETAEAGFTCNGNGVTSIMFNQGYEPHIPEPLKMNVYDLSEEEAAETAEYLAETYGPLLDEGEMAWDIGGDFGYNAQPSEELGEKEGLFRIRQYWIYPKGNSDTETVLNYNYRKLLIYGHDQNDVTSIHGIRIEDRLQAYKKTADYPLISADQAYEQLLDGNCIANTGGIMPDENTEIGDMELVYFDGADSPYAYPAYLFSMDITDKLNRMQSLKIDGVRQYGLYWVPAIDPSYYQWTDDPFTPKEETPPEQPEETVTPEPEQPQETVSPEPTPEPAETPEPPASSASNSISITRLTQETSWYCSVACTQMILNHFGIYKEQNSLAAEENTYAPGIREDGIKGTYDTDVARVLNQYIFGGQPVKETDGGYRVQPVSESFVQSEYSQFISRVKKNINDGYPSILQIRVCDVYGGSVTDNHNVIVSGYEDNGSLYFTIVDPYFNGPSGNGVNTFRASDLFSAIVNSVEPSYIW
ncbi:MAG: C39 family peptidase [Solobacterium sp.]|nr:C39 family peptidase [Solobacterium sp.]